MTNPRRELIRAAAAAAAKTATELAAKAERENRNMTADELADYGRAMTASKSDLERLRKMDTDDEVTAQARALVAEVGGGMGGSGVKHLALTGAGRRDAARGIASKMTATGGTGLGRKGLVDAGNVITATPTTDIVPAGRFPASLLEILPVIQHDGATFKFLRQSQRVNNAAVVPAGATKPTSIYSISGVPNELAVLAHLSEPVDKYLLADVGSLERFVGDELLAGLGLAVEAAILNGNGVGDNLTGILATSGIQVQTAGADDVVTIRAAITKLESTGHEASVVVLSPASWGRIESARNASGNFDLAGPVDRAARTLWSVPVVLSNAVAGRAAVVLDAAAVALDTDRAGIETKWSDAGELFEKNQVKARVEGRFSVSVYQALGVVAVTLPA
ncbi:HK97 family phage major capsid protein [Arthrobacter sp. PL16]|uniref:phage major capsid protein n=1 Tax=Arthrobacter sp. PL16 TaxID=3071720 RepID=UPI002DFCD22F|nr:HK97 family phage major capsid protein [Arthrobacter sp. PL16]